MLGKMPSNPRERGSGCVLSADGSQEVTCQRNLSRTSISRVEGGTHHKSDNFFFQLAGKAPQNTRPKGQEKRFRIMGYKWRKGPQRKRVTTNRGSSCLDTRHFTLAYTCQSLVSDELLANSYESLYL